MTKKQKIALYAVAILLLAAIAMIVYRMFFQFKNSNVNQFVQAEASKYTSNPVKAANLISDSVSHILNSRSLTKQVLDYSSATGVQKEQVLVTAAVMQCKAYGYLE